MKVKTLILALVVIFCAYLLYDIYRFLFLRFKPKLTVSQYETLMNNLKISTEIFDELGVEYCLMYGTLLGSLRHSDIIPWDSDIDLCINSRDVPKLKKYGPQLFKKRGLSLKKAFMADLLRSYPPTGGFIIEPGWPWIDFFQYTVKGNKILVEDVNFQTKTYHEFDYQDFYPFSKHIIGKISANIPAKSHKVISELYHPSAMTICKYQYIPATIIGKIFDGSKNISELRTMTIK